MPKIIAILLVIVWIFYIFFLDSEYAWIIRWLLGVNIGCACAYLWTYDAYDKDLNEYPERMEI